MSFKAEIVEILQNEGFDLVGVASINDPSLSKAVEKYASWIKDSNHASMKYLERHLPKKANPELVLENCKSVVCVGLSYSQKPLNHESNSKPLFSLYTKGEDYHLVLNEKLSRACKKIDQKYGSVSSIFTDIEPVFERFWAARAGLGWVGKNSMLIHKKVGSFFFIGGFFSTLLLDTDSPGVDHCGKCTKCIDACPTSAILPNRTINSNLCIGYHTIESKKEIPDEVASKQGAWVAGCDICQNVCPWNDPPFEKKPFFEKKNPFFKMDFDELCSITESDFKKQTAHLAISRMKYSGFLKNLIVALVNSDQSEKRKHSLLDKISNPSESVLKQLLWAKNHLKK